VGKLGSVSGKWSEWSGVVLVLAGLLALPAVGVSAAGPHGTSPAAKTTTSSLRRIALRKQRFDQSTLLVKFAPGVSASGKKAALAAHGAALRKAIPSISRSLVAVKNPERARKQLEQDPRVASVELNHIRYALATPNDPRFAGEQQYLLPLRLPAAWDVGQGSTAVKIAIVDTGVDLDHPDLAPRIVPGYDFVSNDAVAQDDEGHGTMVAGIAAAGTNNGIGIAGVAWNASIMPLKALDDTGAGSDFDIADAITWAADNGAQVINLSLGGPWSSVTLYDAIQYARQHGAVVVAAAGNDGSPTASYPGAYADLAVSATDSAGDAAWFSNSGYWVDLAAPGIDVTSTALAPGPFEAYAKGAGTSFASPIVAGVAALVRAQHPEWSVARVTQQLLRAWDRGPRGLDPFYGLGVVDAYAAVGAAMQAPAGQPVGDGNEPNEAPKRATPITTSATGTISPEGDEDLFAVDVATPKWFTATMTPPPLSDTVRASEVDPWMDVIGPQGQRQIGSGVDNTAGRSESALVPAGTAGRYYLETKSLASSRGSYSLTVADARAPAVFADEQWRGFPGVDYLRDLALADITGDGRKDVLSAVTDKLMLLPQQAVGGLGQPQWFAVDQGWSYGIGTGDLDGNGSIDVAVASMAGPKIFYAGSGSLSEGPLLSQPSPPRQVVVADMNGDSRPDVVTTGDDGAIRIFRNEASGFTPTTVSPSGQWNLAVGDLTGDGRPDIAACGVNYVIDVFAQSAVGSFTRQRYDQWCGDDIALADMTGDGRTDLVTNGFKTQVFAQTPNGKLAAPDAYHGLSEGYLAAGDLNADGRADLVSIAHNSSEFVQLSQLENGRLAAAPIIYRADYWDGPMAIGDVTGDGKADVLLAQNGGTLVTFPHAASDAPAPLEPGEFWLEDITPRDFALGVPVSTDPLLDFGSDLGMHDGASLISGLSGREAPTGPLYDHRTLSTTVRPATGLAPGTPYVLAQHPQFYSAEAPRLSGAAMSWRFATAGTPDTSVPDTALVGDPQYFPSKATPVFTFTGSKIGSTFECSLDAGPYVPCTSPRDYETYPQPPGQHTFRVRAFDAAGRVDPTPAAITWAVPPASAGAPENDSFAQAFALRAGESSFNGSTVGATKEPGEPNHADNPGGHSLWYSWKAPRGGTFSFDTRYSNLDTLLAVYTGSSVNALTTVASNDNVSATDTTSKVTFSATAGTVYRIAIDGKNGAVGTISAHYVATLGPPANDQFAAAHTLTGPSGTLEASNVGATAEPGEPDYDVYPQPKSIWYRWTAPRSSLFSFDINGSAVRESFELYTGSTLASLVPAGVKTFLPGTGWCTQIYVVATEGVTYIVRLDAAHTPGDWVLNWSDGDAPEGADTTPPDDPTVSSTPLPGWSNDNTVDVQWSGASDDGSGVDGFSYEWSQSAGTVPDTVKDAEETATGTTSPALADGQWWFHLRTGDNAGNWSDPVHLGPFKIDTAAPLNPMLSSTHPQDWSSDNTVVASWTGATDTGSGVDGYSIAWSQQASTVPDAVKDTSGSSATSGPLADGQWWFHLRTVDLAGNWTPAVHLGPFKIDATTPGNPSLSSTHPSDWSSDATVHVSWTGAADTGSGVDGFSYEWSSSSGTVPDTAKDAEEAATETTSSLGDGQWWFHLRTRDNAGNWSATVHLGPFRIDATAPSNPTLSSPSHTVDGWSNDPTVDITWSGASDAASGIDGYSIAWSEQSSTVPDTVKDTSGPPTTSETLPDGQWWFHLRTADVAGNWSPAVHLGPFKIDTVAPTNPTLSSPSHTVGEPSQDSTVEVEWTSLTQADGYSYEWSQDPETQPDAVLDAGGTTTSATSEPLNDGGWWFHLRTLVNGNWSHESHIGPFVIDTIAPVTTISGGPSGTTTSTEAAFEFSTSEPASFQCALDGGPFVACGSPVRYVSLAPGTHVFSVRARDTAGNVEGTPAVRAWTIAAAPQPPAPPPPPPPILPPPPPTSSKVTRCVVPRLTGRTLQRSRTLLTRAGCRLGRVRRAYSPARKQLIYAQSPKAGRRLARGTRVSVWISLGRRPQRR
jgi:subtilisin family serine protease